MGFIPQGFQSARLYIDNVETRLYGHDMNVAEVLEEFAKSMEAGSDSSALDLRTAGSFFGIGTMLDTPVNFMRTNASVTINASGVSPANKYLVYMLFHGFVDV